MNINLLSLSNNKKSSHICVKYGSEDVYTAGKSANCDLTPNWAQFISVAGQRLYTIQRRRPISATDYSAIHQSFINSSTMTLSGVMHITAHSIAGGTGIDDALSSESLDDHATNEGESQHRHMVCVHIYSKYYQCRT